MPEAAITLPLETVETLVLIAKEYARRWANPDSPIIEAIDLAEREVAQVKEMLGGSTSAQD